MKRIAIILTLLLCLASCCQNSGSKNDDKSVNNTAIENILSRKSVRSFTDEAISDEQMTAMLKCAMAAPSGMDVRPWSFVVLTDKSQYDKLFEGNFNLRTFMSAAAVVAICADTTQVRKMDADSDPVRVPNDLWRDDMGAVTENFLLAAESLGLGAVWTACYPVKERYTSLKEQLGLPSTVLPYCLVAVGHPAGENQPKDKFDPERIHYGKW